MTSKADDYLVLSNVYKSYNGEQIAVSDVSLSIRRGEFVSFLGPSGSGKTTTLMMIAGFENPTSGNIMLGDRSLATIPAYRRNIGIVFQNYALFPHMTIRRNIGFPLRMRKMDRDEIERRVENAMAMVGLSNFGERRPRELSGGQQQRVALARALVFEPDVMLLDEPLGALDKNLREQMQFEIKRLHRELGITTIYVTHDQSEAMTLSDRLVVFSQGKIEQIGTPLDVYRQPASRFVAEFIGDCNRLPVTISDPDTGLVDTGAFGQIRLDQAIDLPAKKNYEMVLRPEFIRLGKSDTHGLDFTLTIETIVNYGDTIVAVARQGNQSLRLRLLGYDAIHMAEGTTIKANADARHCWLIPSERSDPLA